MRISITFDEEVGSLVKSYAAMKKVSLAAAVREMVERCIDFDDDAYCASLVKDMIKEQAELIPAEEVWKKLGI